MCAACMHRASSLLIGVQASIFKSDTRPQLAPPADKRLPMRAPRPCPRPPTSPIRAMCKFRASSARAFSAVTTVSMLPAAAPALAFWPAVLSDASVEMMLTVSERSVACIAPSFGIVPNAPMVDATSPARPEMSESAALAAAAAAAPAPATTARGGAGGGGGGGWGEGSKRDDVRGSAGRHDA